MGFDTGDQPLAIFTLPAGTQTSGLKVEETSSHLGWGWGGPIVRKLCSATVHTPPATWAGGASMAEK